MSGLNIRRGSEAGQATTGVDLLSANLTQWVTVAELALIKPEDQLWLAKVFTHFGGYPDLEQLWALMDDPWRDFQCNPELMNESVDAYYAHPVWLLNGLFVESDAHSLANRECFRDWVVQQLPSRVAEFGGGFGGLARMIGAALPTVDVEVIEPYPHPIAIARAEKTSNVRFRPELSGEYDVVVATDVFEHVLDPLQMVAETSQYLRPGGQFLIANCFQPVILCHLPQTFHFRYSWDFVLQAMGLGPAEHVAFGRAFIRRGALNLEAARLLEKRSRALWRFTQHMPGVVARHLTQTLFRAMNQTLIKTNNF